MSEKKQPTKLKYVIQNKKTGQYLRFRFCPMDYILVKSVKGASYWYSKADAETIAVGFTNVEVVEVIEIAPITIQEE